MERRVDLRLGRLATLIVVWQLFINLTSTNAKRDVHHETNADFYLATPMERVSCTLIVIKRAVQCMAAGRDNARTNKKKDGYDFFFNKIV